MKIDIQKGTIDFSQKSRSRAVKGLRLSMQTKIIIAVGLFFFALWLDYTFLTFSIIHEIGHALGAFFTGGGVTSINVHRVLYNGGNEFIAAMAGPFFAVWFWLFVARKLVIYPELSTFFLGIATAELMIDMQANFQYADFYKWPNMRYLLLCFYLTGVIIYVLKLTGGLRLRTTKGS